MGRNSSETLLDLAIEASSKLSFEVLDHFFEVRGQVCPDELSIKCANSTLPTKHALLALCDTSFDSCCHMSNLNQNGFTVFATWSCSHHGCGCVRVHWAQRKITHYECNCTESDRFEYLKNLTRQNKLPKSLFYCRHVAQIMLRRIQTTPDFVKSPPLSNILMNLNVDQLREVLIEIVSWDSSGKDIFDCDYLFTDPIRGIPDLTISEFDTAEPRVDWIASNQTKRVDSVAQFVAKILMATKGQHDFYLVAFGLIRAQMPLLDQTDPSCHYDMLLALSLLHLFTAKYHPNKIGPFIGEIETQMPKTLFGLFRSFVARNDKFQKREMGDCVDIEGRCKKSYKNLYLKLIESDIHGHSVQCARMHSLPPD